MKKTITILCIVMGLIILSCPVNSYPTVIWSDDFEWTNSTGAWDSISASGASANVTLESSSNQSRFGGKSLSIADKATTSATKVLVKNFTPAQSDMYIRFYIFHPSSYTSTGSTVFARLYSGSRRYYMWGFSSADYRPRHQGDVDWTTASWQSANPASGAWHCVEFHATAPNSATTTFDLWLNGVARGSSARLTDNFSDGTGTWDKLEFGFVGNAAASNTDTEEYFLDSLVVADSYFGTGSLGPVVSSTPSAPGAVYDGPAPGVEFSSAASASSLSANWDVAVDTINGISGYSYAVGTTVGDTDIRGWQSNGLNRVVTATGTFVEGTTYYFSVKASNWLGSIGPAANSNGAVVISTADVTPPNPPGIVRDGSTSGVDIASTMSNNTLSANWTAGSDPETGISGYRYGIGTTAGGTNTYSWTNIGNVLTVTRSGLALVAGTTYYFTVKSVNGAGLVSTSAVNSNGQYDVALDTNDYTPPTNISVVRDGTGADISFTGSLTALSANWDASSDPQSGIAKYWYAVGTQQSGAGASNTVPWTDNGQTTMFNASGLTLTAGVTYYVSVKAQNNIGMQSSTTTSNGQTVIPPDTTPPVLSGISVVNRTVTGATIIWTTSEPSTSMVEYGRTSSYGKRTIEDFTLITNHTVAITSLISNALYHFRVYSRDSDGNESTSGDYTFTTLTDFPSTDPSLYAYPNPYNTSYGLPMNFRLNGLTGFYVYVYAPNGRLIRAMESTTETLSWDGKDSEGARVTENVCYAKLARAGEKDKYVFILLNITDYTVPIVKSIPAFLSGDYNIDTVDASGNKTGRVIILRIVPYSNSNSIYPNPCSPTTGNPARIIMNDSSGGEVNIYTLSGRLVKNIPVAAGLVNVPWDGTNESGEKVRKGIYIYRITSNAGGVLTGKLALTK